MSKEIESKVAELLKATGVESKATYCGLTTRNDNWECDAWNIAISAKGKTESFNYFTGLGHRQSKYKMPPHIATLGPKILARVEWEKEYVKPVRPNVASVLHAVILDSSALDTSFTYWCADFGYDEDSIKAFNTYNECCENGKKLISLIGRELFNQLKDALQDY